MSGTFTRIFAFFKRRFREKPLPGFLTALLLSVKYQAIVSPSADIRYPGRLKLGKGARIGRCTILCTGPITLDQNAFVMEGSILDAQDGSISLGKSTGIAPYCLLYGAGGLELGDKVAVAAQCVFVASSHSHDRTDIPIMDQPIQAKGITIGSDVWFGTGCRVLDGTSIGDGSIIGAGSVVTRPIPPLSVAVGIPARVIRIRTDSNIHGGSLEPEK
ncbi:MAG: hypothetical protein CVV64_13495 [Candidatus Wallbacteria bacterium HGW-Wallbacteria-1]|jgi:acetyltransferase-like isoleucine patch superfamily enzyme|uniref:Acyltransferase n=1 Tax=Candidatus Wallbacteria bacterium HGW-Wallbacteria-1 TaxID=2013854 RepID=A0A2N1PML4_9BACT|nr:MAG: hypothetical protein CVV64_13495 [Candidatus Wallbacteria bacterium HGW-Wallbacteria-1]